MHRPSASSPGLILLDRDACGSRRPTVVEATSLASDTLYTGIGSDVFGGLGATLLPVPEAPSPTAADAYLAHLCSALVPSGMEGIVRSLRLAQRIGLRIPSPSGETRVAGLDVRDPFWRFFDGFCNFYLRWIPGGTRPPGTQGILLPTGYSNRLQTWDTAWLAQVVSPYQALHGGLPPGVAVHDLSTIRDLRNGWTNPAGLFTSRIPLVGPGRLSVFVSVKQTDPLRARGPEPTPPIVYAEAEDVFVGNNPGRVRYVGVGASLAVELKIATGKGCGL